MSRRARLSLKEARGFFISVRFGRVAADQLSGQGQFDAFGAREAQ